VALRIRQPWLGLFGPGLVLGGYSQEPGSHLECSEAHEELDRRFRATDAVTTKCGLGSGAPCARYLGCRNEAGDVPLQRSAKRVLPIAPHRVACGAKQVFEMRIAVDDLLAQLQALHRVDALSSQPRHTAPPRGADDSAINELSEDIQCLDRRTATESVEVQIGVPRERVATGKRSSRTQRVDRPLVFDVRPVAHHGSPRDVRPGIDAGRWGYHGCSPIREDARDADLIAHMSMRIAYRGRDSGHTGHYGTWSKVYEHVVPLAQHVWVVNLQSERAGMSCGNPHGLLRSDEGDCSLLVVAARALGAGHISGADEFPARLRDDAMAKSPDSLSKARVGFRGQQATKVRRHAHAL
jgi:hypothetical protein